MAALALIPNSSMIVWPLFNRCARYQNKSVGQRQNKMSNTAKKHVETAEAATMTVVKNPDQEAVQTDPIVPEVEVVPELSLDEKIQKLEDLNILVDRRKKLLESRRSLQTFRISADGLSNQLVLHDLTSHTEFKTYNAALISRVMDVMRETVDEKLMEVEAQIKF